MRYFFVSDIHGTYDKLIAALTAVGFDMQRDTLVSVGDAFDRGNQNKKVLEFLLSCPHRILLWGNHDRRLYEIALGQSIAEYDISNGTTKTVRELAHDLVKDEDKGNLWACKDALKNCKPLWQYFRECHFALEFPDLIATHAWLPTCADDNGGVKLYPRWREVHTFAWDNAVWEQTAKIFKNDAVYPEKPLLVGHWWAWDIAEHCGVNRTARVLKKNAHIDCSTFVYQDKLICIDGCSNYENGGCINVYVYESDVEPTLIW